MDVIGEPSGVLKHADFLENPGSKWRFLAGKIIGIWKHRVPSGKQTKLWKTTLFDR